MSRGRKPNLVPTVQWSIMVPIDLAFQVESQLMDPVTKKSTYAARSKLLQHLLYEWLKERGVNPLIPTDVLCPQCKRPKATSIADVLSGSCPKWFITDDSDKAYSAADAETNCLRHTQSDLPIGA